MKEKLEVIREALEVVTNSFRASVAFDSLPRDGGTIQNALDSIALLDTLIAELESKELVERVAEAIVTRPNSLNKKGNSLTLGTPRYKQACGDAQAAINAINGVTATRDRE